MTPARCPVIKELLSDRVIEQIYCFLPPGRDLIIHKIRTEKKITYCAFKGKLVLARQIL